MSIDSWWLERQTVAKKTFLVKILSAVLCETHNTLNYGLALCFPEILKRNQVHHIRARNHLSGTINAFKFYFYTHFCPNKYLHKRLTVA